MKHILPVKATRQYVYCYLASNLGSAASARDRCNFWLGPHNSGMYELMQLYEKTLGNYYVNLSSQALNHASPELFVGKRFCSVTGNPEGQRWITTAKQLMSQDTLVTSHRYYAPHPQQTVSGLTFLCDTLPDVQDGGMRRRLVVINFDSVVTDTPVLSHEMFFVILSLWHKVYRANGSYPPLELTLAGDKTLYKKLFSCFLACVDEADMRSSDADNQYNLFKKWYVAEFEEKAPTKKYFTSMYHDYLSTVPQSV